jgi:YD repeat-containing protein
MTYRKLVLSGLFSSKGMLAPITPSSDCCAETLLSKVATVSIQVFEIPNLHSQHFLGTKQVSANLNWNPNGTLSYLSITDPLNPLNQQTCSTYSYDDFGRLTQVTCGTTWAQTFTYDSFGNIKKTAGKQMWTPTYDSANNNRYPDGWEHQLRCQCQPSGSGSGQQRNSIAVKHLRKCRQEHATAVIFAN